MKNRTCKEEYLERAKLLSDTDAELVLSRMSGKLYRRLEKEGFAKEEIMGIQLEIEEDQLREWREKMAGIQSKEKEKKKNKNKSKK
jgi:hypothetical protein